MSGEPVNQIIVDEAIRLFKARRNEMQLSGDTSFSVSQALVDDEYIAAELKKLGYEGSDEEAPEKGEGGNVFQASVVFSVKSTYRMIHLVALADAAKLRQPTAEFALSLVCSADKVEETMGDLEEGRDFIRRRFGPTRAKVWYGWKVFEVIMAYTFHRAKAIIGLADKASKLGGS